MTFLSHSPQSLKKEKIEEKKQGNIYIMQTRQEGNK